MNSKKIFNTALWVLLFFLVLALALGLLAGMSEAGELPLAWEAVPDATGYRIYYSADPAGGVYPDHVEVGNVTAATITIPDCQSSCVVIRAINNAGESAKNSNEVCGHPTPEVSSVEFETSPGVWAQSIPSPFQGVVRITGMNLTDVFRSDWTYADGSEPPGLYTGNGPYTAGPCEPGTAQVATAHLELLPGAPSSGTWVELQLARSASENWIRRTPVFIGNILSSVTGARRTDVEPREDN